MPDWFPSRETQRLPKSTPNDRAKSNAEILCELSPHDRGGEGGDLGWPCILGGVAAADHAGGGVLGGGCSTSSRSAVSTHPAGNHQPTNSSDIDLRKA